MRKGPVLLISPHPDDAAYSLGAALQSRSSARDVYVLNLFSEQEYSVLGESGEAAKRRILAEEEQAARTLGFHADNGGLPEAGLRGYKRLRDMIGGTAEPWTLPQEQPIMEKGLALIRERLASLQPAWLLAPLGVQHVDHLLAARMAVVAWQTHAPADTRLLFYEDLPYCTDPRAAETARAKLTQQGLTLRPRLLQSGTDRDWHKADAVKLYRSQLRDRQVQVIVQYGHSLSDVPAERVWLAGRTKGNSVYESGGYSMEILLQELSAKVKVLLETDREVEADAELKQSGFDSVLIMQLIVELEQSYDIEFDDDDMLQENFSTIRKVAERIELKRAKQTESTSLQ